MTLGDAQLSVVDLFAQLSERHGLRLQEDRSPEDLPQRYLFSQDMAYRYAFGRWWGVPDLRSTVGWVLLNPATGDTERRRRPTLDRIIAWSRRLPADGVLIVNLFAYRATDPRQLRAVADPVGEHNETVLRCIVDAVPTVVAAWGGHGALRGRATQLRGVLGNLHCLGTTGKGQPRHPLYVSGQAELRPLPWAG